MKRSKLIFWQLRKIERKNEREADNIKWLKIKPRKEW